MHLDGLPLAIELAAARVKLLQPEELLTRLKSRLDLLTRGSRNLSERHRTLQNTISWSYDLLDATEQMLFTQLAVFAGGWTVEAAETVCNMGDAPLDILDGLSSLLDKSLLRQPMRDDGALRFIMLRTIREYALDRLVAGGEEEAVRSRHAEYYLTLAEQAVPHLQGAEQLPWLNLLEIEHDNFRAALAWAQQSGDTGTGARLAGALGRFWFMRGYWTEGRRWLETALASNTGVAASVRVRALNALGTLARHQNDYDVARAQHRESLLISRELEDKPNIADALRGLGDVAMWQGDNDQATAYLEFIKIY